MSIDASGKGFNSEKPSKAMTLLSSRKVPNSGCDSRSQMTDAFDVIETTVR